MTSLFRDTCLRCGAELGYMDVQCSKCGLRVGAIPSGLLPEMRGKPVGSAPPERVITKMRAIQTERASVAEKRNHLSTDPTAWDLLRRIVETWDENDDVNAARLQSAVELARAALQKHEAVRAEPAREYGMTDSERLQNALSFLRNLGYSEAQIVEIQQGAFVTEASGLEKDATICELRSFLQDAEALIAELPSALERAIQYIRLSTPSSSNP